MHDTTVRSLMLLALLTVVAGCDSSSVSSEMPVNPEASDSRITIPDTSRAPLTQIPEVAFDGQFETTASPERGTGSTDTDLPAGESDSVEISVDSSEDVSDGSTTGVSAPTDEIVGGPVDPNPTITPGTLTAGDYDDQLNPHLYQRYASDYLQSRGQWIDTPRIDFNHRILISVTDVSARPHANAQVQITVPGGSSTTLHTAANGQTSIYTGLDSLTGDFNLKVTASNGAQVEQLIDLQHAIEAGQIDVTLATFNQNAPASTPVDLMFVVDTTGSMGDELSFLQTELSDIISAAPQQQTDVNIGLVFYRDYGDTYVVRAHGFSGDINSVQLNLNQEQAQGGGDYPEAMDQALNAAIGADWRSNSRKILFLLADAPPHGDRMRATWNAAEQARVKNIHLVPVAASGVAADAQYIMRSIAALTNSRYLFLTDDSGYGLPHGEPDIDCYVVTSLRNAMIRTMNSLVSGNRIEPTANDIIRTAGNYNNGVCDGTDSPPGNAVEYTVLIDRFSIQTGSFTTHRTLIIDNQTTLDDELTRYGHASQSIDFTTQQVLLIDIGQRNTGGYRINIDSINEFDDYVQADIEYTQPGTNCGVTTALTNPYQFVAVTTQKEIRLSENYVVVDCE